jgi:transcriptional regulator with XRE-family HTH domain
MRNIIGKRVQEARRNNSLSQEELATKLELDGWKISRVSLAKIETGTRQVTDIQVMILCEILKVSPEWLLDKDEFKRSRLGE